MQGVSYSSPLANPVISVESFLKMNGQKLGYSTGAWMASFTIEI
jgi:hypothetical protein